MKNQIKAIHALLFKNDRRAVKALRKEKVKNNNYTFENVEK
jgi:hypothetical protein